MDMPFKKFANFLVIKFSKLNCNNPDFLKKLSDYVNDKPIAEIIKSIALLSHHFRNFTTEINIKNFEEFACDNELRKEEYMQYLIIRCLKLSQKDSKFFEFLLVCLYICKIAEFVFARYKCCKILKFTSDSLEVVYFREYFKYFKKHGGILGLADFCKRLNVCPPSIRYGKVQFDTIELIRLVHPHRHEKAANLKLLNDVDGKIELSSEERKLLVDKAYFVANNRSEDFLLDWGLKEDDAVNEILVTEKVYKTAIRCDYCRSKCFQYLEDLSQTK